MGPLTFPADQWREVAGHNKGGFCLIGREQLRNPGILLAYPKRWETGFTIYHSNMRTLEYLTVCKFHNKGNTFSSVFSLWPWVLAHSKAWTLNLPQGNQVLHNMSFNQVWVKGSQEMNEEQTHRLRGQKIPCAFSLRKGYVRWYDI